MHKRKVHIKKKGRAYEFYDKGKIDAMNFWEQKNLFQLNTLVQRWSFHRIYEIKNIVFLSQKVDGNMIFTDYWKVLVLTFSEMGNTIFSWAKKLTEIWCLLITGKFLFWTFRWWEIRSFFESRSWWKDDIYWLLRSSCFELFGDGKYGLFFSQKVDGKIIFSWSFWAFHDIPGLEKYGFSCSDHNFLHKWLF